MPLSTLAHARRANRGKFAENLLATTHQVYRLEGLASLTPIPSPIGRKSRRDENARPGQFTAWYKQKSTSDYLGVIAPEGRALAAQGKSDEAIRHYNEALRLRPDYPQARQELQAITGQKPQ